MSAFLVSKEHIDAIVTLVANGSHYRGKAIDEIGQILWDENVRSVNFRYRAIPEYQSDSEKYSFCRNQKSAVQVLKLIQSLEYQSCESDDWEFTEAYRILKLINEIAIHALSTVNFVRIEGGARIDQLAGYNEAEWAL